MNTYNTFAPLFPGFYNTVFQYDREDQDIEDYNAENGTDYSYDDFVWDYAEYQDRIAKKFLSRLQTELAVFLPIKLEFQEVVSPREYNFKNDSINIAVELDINQLLILIASRRNIAAEYFKNTYTSQSGFISFHSSHIDIWLDVKYILEKPAHRIGALLDCLCFCEIDTDDITYWCDDECHINFNLSSTIDQPI